MAKSKRGKSTKRHAATSTVVTKKRKVATPMKRKKRGHHREARRTFPLSEQRKRTAISEMLGQYFSPGKSGRLAEIVDFVRSHTFLEPLLPETAEALRDYYGEDTRIVLDLVHVHGHEIPSLVMSIESESSATEGCVALDEFEEKYWRKMVSDVVESVRFDFQASFRRKGVANLEVVW